MRLFSELAERNLFSTYAAALDWILSDHKFSVNLWDNKNKVQAFTKAFHRMEGVSQGRVHYEPKRGTTFPRLGEYRQHKLFTFYITRGNSEARDLIRHIRNGIAHGHIHVHELDGELIVELLDFGKESNQPDRQTAYMVFPLRFLNDIFELYRQKEQQWVRNVNRK